jgi:hypothetical protein
MKDKGDPIDQPGDDLFAGGSLPLRKLARRPTRTYVGEQMKSFLASKELMTP